MAKYLKLENLIYLIIFLLPTYLIGLNFYFFRTNVLEVLILIAAGWWFLLFYKKEKLCRVYLEYRRYFFCAALLLSGLFLSAFSHGQSLQSLGIIKGWFIFPMILAWIAFDIVPVKKRQNVFAAYGASAIGAALISLGYLALGQVTYDGRLQAFFNSPNYLAMFLAPGIIFLLWRLIFERKSFNEVAVLSVLLVSLFFTYSYASWAAVFMGASFMLWAGRTQLKKVYFFKIVLFIVVTGTLLLFSQVGQRKFNEMITASPRSSLVSREMIWQAAGKMVENNFILGIGPSNFQKTYLEYQKFFPLYLEWAVPHPQNIYLAFWLSGGILGLVGFLGLIGFFFRDSWKSKNQNVLGVLVLGIMVYILVHGLFDTTYFKNDLAVVFWLNFLVLREE